MIKDMGTITVLIVIKATVAMEDMTTLATTIPITDMGQDTQITVVSVFDLITDNNSASLNILFYSTSYLEHMGLKSSLVGLLQSTV